MGTLAVVLSPFCTAQNVAQAPKTRLKLNQEVHTRSRGFLEQRAEQCDGCTRSHRMPFQLANIQMISHRVSFAPLSPHVYMW